MKEEHADQYMKLDTVPKIIADAIIWQQDVFVAFHKQLYQITRNTIEQEHGKTRQVIVNMSEKILLGIPTKIHHVPTNYFLT